jgi:hypothetical protein
MHDNVSDSVYRINDLGYWVARTSLTIACNVSRRANCLEAYSFSFHIEPRVMGPYRPTEV